MLETRLAWCPAFSSRVTFPFGDGGQVVTTNYKARELGVQKMTNIDEALKQCPELILLPGEDLTPYRDASKRIYKTLARFGTAAQRLGMDEVTLRPPPIRPSEI